MPGFEDTVGHFKRCTLFTKLHNVRVSLTCNDKEKTVPGGIKSILRTIAILELVLTMVQGLASDLNDDHICDQVLLVANEYCMHVSYPLLYKTWLHRLHSFVVHPKQHIIYSENITLVEKNIMTHSSISVTIFMASNWDSWTHLQHSVLWLFSIKLCFQHNILQNQTILQYFKFNYWIKVYMHPHTVMGVVTSNVQDVIWPN